MTAQEAIRLGIECHQAGRLAEAEALYRQVLEATPGSVDTALNLGSLLYNQGRFAESAGVYQGAIALNPAAGGLWCNLSNTLLEMDQIEPSIAAAKRAIDLERNSFGAHNNLGNGLKAAGQAEAAAAAFRKSIALRPDFYFAHNNLGIALHSLGDVTGAIVCFRRALELNPHYTEAINNLSNALGDVGEWEQAMKLAMRNRFARPDNPSCRWNLGLLLLRNGDYARGWAEYEWRWRIRNMVVPPMRYTEPWWNGEELNGRRILIHAEQGLGDTIQFVRYVPLVAARGGKVILHYPDALLPVLSNIPGVAQTVPWSQLLPPFDVHCPLLSLPSRFGTTVASVPAPIPYVKADENLASAWKEKLAAKGKIAGLVWAGRAAYAADKRRSMPLSALAPLAGAKGWDYVSLQVGERAAEARTGDAGIAVRDLSGDLTDFGQTAAAIANLDLVISVDTAVAHLAGAMGKPVWVVLPLGPDWRWMLKRSDSPWYPTARLFRQKKFGDWTSPAAEMAEALKTF